MRIKNLFRIISYLFIFSFSFISMSYPQITNVMEEDGTYWEKVSESFKLGYLVGLLSGLGVAESELSYYEDDLKEKRRKEFKEDIRKVNLYNITIGQIRDGIDVFYKDFSNRRIKIIDAVYVIKMQIEGKDPELIKIQIRYLKMQPIDPVVDYISFGKWREFFSKNNRLPTYLEIKNGDFSLEDLIRNKMFVDVNNDLHSLFCYGKYK